jgi:hypothetical protein
VETLGLLEKEEEGGRASEGTTRRSYTPRKRRRARARALPDAAGAKPGGANTTLQIIKLFFFFNYLI